MPPAGKNAPWPSRELAVQELAFDLKAHKQEEQGHEGVIDPVQDGETGSAGLQEAEIGGAEGRVRDGERRSSGCHQEKAAGGFAVEELAESGWGLPARDFVEHRALAGR